MPDTKQQILAQIENNFSYHPPQPGQSARYEAIRGAGKELAKLLVDLCPVSRELSIALSNLENVVFWANAAIARNPTEPAKAERNDA